MSVYGGGYLGGAVGLFFFILEFVPLMTDIMSKRGIFKKQQNSLIPRMTEAGGCMQCRFLSNNAAQ